MNNNIINNKYKVLHKIGSGSFGSIYKGVNIRTNEFVAIKVEPIVHNLKLLKNESKIYYFLNDCYCIPKVKWYGKDFDNYYMVIDFLGESLQDLMDRTNKLPLILILKLGIKILIIFITIHEKGLIHRDVKPSNFLFGLNEINNIYLIDFGFCKPYLNNGQHIEFKKINGMIGSKNYASTNSHNKIELSRRDDLESLCYMLLYFYSGYLPWNHIDDDESIVLLKQDIINNQSYPSVILDFLKYIKLIKYDEKPNYYLIIDSFKKNIELLSKNNI
jgi:serine/threonine protein kinase